MSDLNRLFGIIIFMQNQEPIDSVVRGSSKFDRFFPAVAIAVAVLFLAGLFLPLPQLPLHNVGRILGVVLDALHGPAFALFAALLVLALQRLTNLRAQNLAIVAWITVVGCGVLTEIGQSFIGRSASWHDIIANSLGATAGVLWTATRTSPSRRLRRRSTAVAVFLLCAAAAHVPIVLTDCIIQQVERPMLASFERPLEMIRWQTHGCDMSQVAEHATHGHYALRLQPGKETYFGVASRKIFFEWTDDDSLAFDITVVDADNTSQEEVPDDVEVTARIKDRLATKSCNPADQFERVYRLRPGTHTIKIPLNEVVSADGRKMDPSHLSLLHIYVDNTKRPCNLYLDNVRMMPGHK